MGGVLQSDNSAKWVVVKKKLSVIKAHWRVIMFGQAECGKIDRET